MIQDEIQGYHWSKQQCTLPPLVIYYKENSKLKSMSLSIISDDLDHDAASYKATHWTQTHNHLVRKQSLAKWLSVCL